MRYNVKATLDGTDRLVHFDDIFRETLHGVLDLVGGDLPQSAYGKFSYGTVHGGKMVKDDQGQNALSFPQRGAWNFSSIHPELIDMMKVAIEKRRHFAFGMHFNGVENIPTRYIKGTNFVRCYPGVVLREMNEDGTFYFQTMRDDGEEMFSALERHTSRRIEELDPNIDSNIIIRPVVSQVYRHKTAWFDNHSYIYNDAVLSINASKDAMELIACIGLGDMTHLGFGYVTQVDNPALHLHPDYKGRVLSAHETMWTDKGFI